MFVTFCDVNQCHQEHLHMLAKGYLSYILRTASGRTDSHDVNDTMRFVPMIESVDVGAPLRRRLVLL